MDGELIVRPGVNDERVVIDLLAPTPSSTLQIWGPPISRIVADAHLVSRLPLLADAVAAVGVPYLIDPNTHFLQTDLRASDSWAKLPYGQAKALTPSDLSTDSSRNDLIDRVVAFQVEGGATAVIAPYLYSSNIEDPWFEISTDLLRRTAQHMEMVGIRFPLIAVLCAQLQSFGATKNGAGSGLDAFAAAARASNASAIAVCLSPAGSQHDGYAKVLRLFRAFDRMQKSTLPILAWHQGVYGPALVAAGAAGYESGIGTNEQTDVLRALSNRRPKQDGQKRLGGAAPGIFFAAFGRSISPAIGSALLGNIRMRAKIMCDDENCCPLGVRSTLEHHREHAVRSRSRSLTVLNEMPQRAWRLHRIASEARAAATLLDQANKILKAERLEARLHTTYSESIGRVAEFLLDTDRSQRQSADGA